MKASYIYQRNIKIVKGLVALVGMSTLVAVFAIPLYKNFILNAENKDISKQIRELNLSTSISQSVVENLKFYGTDAENMPYSIFASKGYEKDLGIYLLKNMHSDFQMSGSMLSLQADNAEMRKATNSIILDGNVTFVSDNGYSLQSGEATLNIVSKAAHGSKNVELKGSLGQVNSENFKVNDGATEIVFSGVQRVKTKLISNKLNDKT